MWSNKYIGIPFKARGRDYTGVDCWGLVRLVYQEQYSIELPSFEQEYTIADKARISELIAQYREGWEQVDTPQEGDIVLFNVLGQPRHVGVMINSTEFLHSRNGYDVAIGSIHGTRWASRVLGFYKYVDKTLGVLRQVPISLQATVITKELTEPTQLDVIAQELFTLSKLEKDQVVILLNNTPIPEEYWPSTTLNHSDIVSYRLVPGEEALKLAAIVVIAVYFPEYLMAEMAFSAPQAAFATMAATTVASIALNSIFPPQLPKQPTDPGSSEQQYMANGGGNTAQPYRAIPIVLGKIKFTPPLAAQSYITYPEERLSYLTMSLTWGFGPLTFSNFKIGEADISDYVIKDSITLNGYSDTQGSINKYNELYARDVNQPQWNAVTMVCDGTPGFVGEVVTTEGVDAENGIYYYQTTVPGNTPIASPGIYYNPPASSDTASEVSIAFHMPQGMRRVVTKGQSAGTSELIKTRIQTQYKFNNGSWQDWETFDIEGNKKDAYTIVRTKTFSSEGIIQVQARRLTGDNTEDDANYRYLHDVVLLNVTYTSNRNPIKIPPNTYLARSVYIIQASDQLNGQLEGINAIVQSICRPVTAPTGNYTLATSNPAALFLHVLTHPANPQRIELNELSERVNLTQLEYWYNYCDTARTISFEDNNSSGATITKTYKYEYNGIIGEQRSVLDVLRDICAAGRASPAMIDGKWTVTIDEPKTAITQHFSPHNSWGFEAIRSIPKEPDGLKVTFYDEEQDYQQVETIIYNTGKNYSNSTLFESIELRGVTNRGTVVDHAKWHFAQGKLRREVYSLNCDIEYLACNRGDRVKVTHDVTAWGTGSGRIKYKFTDTTGNISVIQLTESLPIDYTKSYNIRIRSKTGASTTFNVPTQINFTGFSRTNNTINITLNPATVATIPFDETETISIECAGNTGINIQNQTVSINRQTNTISYTVSSTPGTSGFNNTPGIIKLNGYYKYVVLSSPTQATNVNVIDIDNLFLFGEVNKESQDLIVLSIEPQQNKTARLTFVDYGVTSTYNIFTDYKTLTSNTVFNTLITLPGKNLINTFTDSQTPTITKIYSNDDAVEIVAPSVYKYNIKVSYATSQVVPVNTKYVQCEYGYTTGSNSNNTKIINSQALANTITISDVIEGEQYKIRLRYVTETGITGPWSSWETHVVQGITKNNEIILNTDIVAKRVGKFIRVTINTPIPNNFKSFIIKIYKNSTNIGQDFWNVQDSQNIKTIITNNNTADFNILDFPSPRISEAGTTYRIACRLVDLASKQSASGLSNIILFTISP